MLQRFALIIAPLLGAAVAIIPWHDDPHVRKGIALVAACLILWISEAASPGMVALCIPVAATLLDLLSWKDSVAAWGDPIVFLFLGAFLLARALAKHRVFHHLLPARWLKPPSPDAAGRGPIFGILILAGLVSTVQNNTAVTAILLPIVLIIVQRAPSPAPPLMALAYGATFGGLATPIGTAPNLIGYREMIQHESTLSFLTWMRVGVPVWIGTTLIGWAALRIAATFAPRTRGGAASATAQEAMSTAGPAEPPSFANAPLDHEPADARSGRRAALAAFGCTATIWLLTGVIQGFMSPEAALVTWTRKFLPESLVAVAAAASLFFIRNGAARRPVLDRDDLHAIDWDTLFLIGGGLCLGTVLRESGAANWIAAIAAGSELPPTLLMLAIGGATVLLSELTSNTATAALMTPLGAALAARAGLSPVPVIWTIALCASLGFALPISTPPNAIVYGTRLIRLRFMLATGLMIDVLSTIWVVVCVQTLA